MHTVIIDGPELEYFVSVCRHALSGDYGTLSSVQLYVEDDGRIVLGSNGDTSRAFGRPNAPLGQHSSDESVAAIKEAYEAAALANSPADDAHKLPGYVAGHDVSSHAVIPEGSGNPYANVPDGDDLHPRSSCTYPAGCTGCLPTTLEDRVIRLERFAANVAQQYGLIIEPAYGSSVATQ